MHQVEVGLLAAGHVLVAGVAAEGRYQGEPATLEKIFDDERVAADVVLAQHVDLEFALDRPLGLADDVLEELVVGDVVSGRLADALVALATEAEDIDAQRLLHLAGHGMDVVADQSDRTGGADRDHPGLEDLVGLKDGLLELLLAAEDDLLLPACRWRTNTSCSFRGQAHRARSGCAASTSYSSRSRLARG